MARTAKPWYRKDRQAWFVTLDGQRHNLGPERVAAFRRFHEMMAEPQKQVAPSETLVTIIDLYLEWAEKNRSPDTYEWYRYRLERLARKYPNLRADALKPYQVQDWVDEYQLSVTSRRDYFRAIKRCLRWAVRQGYLDRSPIAELEVPAGERRETIVSTEEYAAILGAITDQDFYDLVVVTWETGCRPQESLRVEGRHVDRNNKRWVFPKSESKNKKLSRVVYLTETAFEIVQRRMLVCPTGPLFRNSVGKRWSTEAVNCAFGRIRVKLGLQLLRDQQFILDDDEVAQFMLTLQPVMSEKGKKRPKKVGELRSEAKKKLLQRKAWSLVPNYSLYALRHSWATHALQRGVDPLTVAILMGHSDPSMLARVYQHLSLNPEHLRSQLAKAVG